jgi:VanZ like family
VPTLLVEHAALVPAALLLVVLGCAGVGLATRARPRALRWLTGLALVPVLGLTLAPDDRGRVHGRCEVGFALPSPGSAELLANVALFVPVAVFAVLLLRRPWRVALGGSLLSAGIEGVQAVVVGLGRSCTTNDWAANTAGAVLGVVVGVAVGRVGRVAREG